MRDERKIKEGKKESAVIEKEKRNLGDVKERNKKSARLAKKLYPRSPQ